MATESPPPTPEEIEAACREIRKRWNTGERYRRAHSIMSDERLPDEGEQSKRPDE